MAKALSARKQTPRTFKLQITEGEADFLLGVLAAINGDPDKSPRKYAARLSRILSRMTGYDGLETDAVALSRGAIAFYNYGHEPVTLEKRFEDTENDPVIAEVYEETMDEPISFPQLVTLDDLFEQLGLL